MSFNINNNSVQLQLPAPELLAVMDGTRVTIGTLLHNPCKIIFDNLGAATVSITMSSLNGGLQTWKTFPGGEALVLDNDLECFPAGTTFYGTGASGTFSIAYTYIQG